jgi:hypothetical protein
MPPDYSGQNLRGRSFKGQNLTGANFSKADIRGANFTNAILKDADFSGAKRVFEKSLMVYQIFLDPPKSPLKRGTLTLVPPLNKGG